MSGRDGGTRRAWAWARWGLLFAGAAWLALRLWALSVVHFAVPAFEARHGALSAESLKRETPPSARNGASYFEAAATIFDASETEANRIAAAYRRGDAPPGEDRDRELRALAERNRLALDLFRAGAREPICGFLTEPPLLSTEVPPVIVFLQIARLSIVLDRIASREVEGSFAAPGIGEILALSSCLQQERALLLQLLGTTIERMTLDRLHATLADPGFTIDFAGVEAGLPAAERIPSLEETARWDLLLLRPHHDGLPGYGWIDPGSFWNPLAVRGFVWAESVRGYGLALDALNGRREPPPAPAGWAFRPSDLVFPNYYSTLESWPERRRRAMLAREIARGAVRLRRTALDAGEYRAAFDSGSWLPDSAIAPRDDIELDAGPDGSVAVGLRVDRRPADDASPQHPHRSPQHWSYRLPPIAPRNAAVAR